MFHLFRKSQKKTIFDAQYQDFVNEYRTMLDNTAVTCTENEESGKNFVEITDCQVAELQELIYHLDELNDRVTSTLVPSTTEQEIEKMTLQNAIAKAVSSTKDSIEWVDAIKNAYIQGLNDGYNLERN